MRSRFLTLAVLAVLAAPAAYATPTGPYVYNTINTPSAGTVGSDGHSDSLPYLAGSFMESGGFNSISVGLLLSAPAHDGNSLSVYLVADNNAGPVGVAGLPSWTSHQLIGTISDNTLAATPTMATVSAVLNSPASSTKEYWVEVVLGTSTADWYGSSSGQGTGIAGQSVGFGISQSELGGLASANLVDGNGIAPVSTNGSYAMDVSVPEPATVALLGIGLASLGILRRRKHA